MKFNEIQGKNPLEGFQKEVKRGVASGSHDVLGAGESGEIHRRPPGLDTEALRGAMPRTAQGAKLSESF